MLPGKEVYMKKGAIFDMDGLLFDTQRYFDQSWPQVAAEMGYECPDEFMKELAGSSGRQMRMSIEKYFPGVDYVKFLDRGHELVQEKTDRELPVKPGAEELVKYFFENGVKIAVASGNRREVVESNLRKAGLMKYVDAVICGAEVSNAKPDPEIFVTAAKMLGLKSEECYVFEDSLNGVHAGGASGSTTIMVPDLREPDEKCKETAAGIYQTLTEAMENIRDGKI